MQDIELIMTNFTAAVQRQVARGGADVGTLKWAQVEDVLGWTGDVDGIIFARLLIGQIASDPTEALAHRCAQAILATDIREELLDEVVLLVPPCVAGIQVISQILRVVRPAHRLARQDVSGTHPFAVYDAIDDGTLIRISSVRGERPLRAETSGLLLGVEAPLDQIARFRIESVDDDGAYLAILDDAEWLERERITCPPMIVIA